MSLVERSQSGQQYNCKETVSGEISRCVALITIHTKSNISFDHVEASIVYCSLLEGSSKKLLKL